MASAPQDISRSLQAFAAGFHEQGKQLSELQTTSPATFQQVVLSLLLEARDTPRFRFLIAYLSSRGLLPQCVRALRGVDRGLAAVVVELAERMVPDGAALAESLGEKGAELDASYLLGLLEAFSTGLNLLTIHAGAMESLETRLRARLATILGKAARTHDTFLSLVGDADARVRANAVESLWGSMSGMAKAIFTEAAGDRNHRVAANALIGLYMLGDPASVAGLEKMLGRPDAASRAAAAWAMGRTGDGRFAPLLQSTRRKPGQDPMVVRNCLGAVKRVTHTVVSSSGRELGLRILDGQPSPPGRVTLKVSARVAGSQELPQLAGTLFQASCGEEAIWDYQCAAVPAGPALAVAFMLPVSLEGMRAKGRSYRAVITEAFARRRASDRVALALYSEERMATPNPLFGASALAADAADINETLADIPGPANVPQGPFGPMEELASRMKAFEGDRHMVWVVDKLAGAFLEKAQTPALGSVNLHVICMPAAPPAAVSVAAKLSRATGGVFVRMEAGDELDGVCEDLVASFYLHYRLNCQAPKEAGRWRVEVAGGGFGGKAER